MTALIARVSPTLCLVQSVLDPPVSNLSTDVARDTHLRTHILTDTQTLSLSHAQLSTTIICITSTDVIIFFREDTDDHGHDHDHEIRWNFCGFCFFVFLLIVPTIPNN